MALPNKVDMTKFVDTGDTVSVAPFVDDTEDGTESKPYEAQEAVVNDEEAANSDADNSNTDSSDDSKSSIMDEIAALKDGQNRILQALGASKHIASDDDDADDDVSEDEQEGSADADAEDDSEDEDMKGKDMAAKLRKHATDDDGNIEQAPTADEVLDAVTDEGIAFEDTVDDAGVTTDESAVNNGDNENGSDEEPTGELEPVTTASAMRLADKYIKAGVISEDARYDAVERISKLSKIAAHNQMIALNLVARANKVKAAKLAKLASTRKAGIKDLPESEWDEYVGPNHNGVKQVMVDTDNPEVFTVVMDDGQSMTFTEDGSEAFGKDALASDVLDAYASRGSVIALADRNGVVHGTVKAHNGKFAWKLADQMEDCEDKPAEGEAETLEDAVEEAAEAFDDAADALEAVTEETAAKASDRRAARRKAISKKVASNKAKTSLDANKAKAGDRIAKMKAAKAAARTPRLASAVTNSDPALALL